MLKYIISFLLLLSVFEIADAQKLNTKSKRAMDLYRQGGNAFVENDYEKAIKLLQEAVKKDKKFKEAYLLLADIYFTRKDYRSELEMLKRAVEIDSTFFLSAYYNMGVANFYLGNRDKTVYWMKKYKEKTEGKKSRLDADRWIEQAQFAEQAEKNPVAFDPVNLGPSVNSDYDEYWPSITADEEVLVFTVLVPRDSMKFLMEDMPKIPANFQEDFYVSKKIGGDWCNRVPVKGLNTAHNEGAQCLSVDGQWMFFTACGKKGGRGSCDIWFSYKTADGWSEPANLGPPVNTPYWESQPSFSSDGRTLYFASNRKGGKGGRDLWKATLIGFNKNNVPVFSKAENLGDKINTPGEESSPFIHPDNRSLYFASDGWPGMGNRDLFVSRRDKNGEWGIAENLGYPINTSKDEMGLIINAKGSTAYFSSDGIPSETAGKDLYMFKMPEKLRPNPVTYVKGNVYDKNTGDPLQAAFVLKELESDIVQVSSLSDKYDGSFLVCLPVGHSYALSVKKPGYLFYSDNFDLEGVKDVDNPQKLTVYLSPIKPGEKIILKNIFFATDSFELKKESFPELNTLVDLLSQNPDLKVEIGGHTDNVGSEQYNKVLSENRARSVYNYLISKGIDKKRLTYKGYGYSQPIADNNTEEGRAKNRRTEIKVMP
ncbi:MAG: OmpA family protein [Chlorobi bacterium]|nr:OmpA family protein [Chlorobiota bacterium]